MKESKKERELILRRDIPFSRDLVWQAITDPEHMKRWWGPDGFTIEGVVMDLRVGGVWSFIMVGPDGTRYPNHSVFKEIIPSTRLIFDHGDGERIWFESSIIIQETSAGSQVTLRSLFPSREARDLVIAKFGAVEGGKQHLAKLEDYIRGNLA